MSNEANKQTVEKMWRALGQMDWETLKSICPPREKKPETPEDAD